MTCQSLPFGNALNCSGGPDSAELHFSGKERDAESGNDYFEARYYASSMGRFMSPDPSGLLGQNPADPQSWNLYAYARNNPLINIDPNGLDCIYATNNGKGVESIDHDSDSGECGQNAAIQLRGGHGAMNGLAEETVVETRNMSCDQFPLAWCQCTFTAKQDINQLVDRFSGLWTEGHGPNDARKFTAELGRDGQLDMCHTGNNSFLRSGKLRKFPDFRLPSQFGRRERRTFDSGPYFSECRIPSGGGIIGERCEAAIVGRAQLFF